jgi:hypothetical protein
LSRLESTSANFARSTCLADIAARTGRLRPYFLYLGNCIGRKNPTGLLEAFRHSVVEAGVDADLVMVGPYYVAVAGAAELGGLAAAHGLADRLVVLDAIDREQMTLLYNGALAPVFPSLFEGFGLRSSRRWACGTCTDRVRPQRPARSRGTTRLSRCLVGVVV